MSNKEREEDKKRKEADKDFGLPDIEITPIDQEQKGPVPAPIAPAPQETPKAAEEKPKAKEIPEESKTTAEEPVKAAVPPVEEKEKNTGSKGAEKTKEPEKEESKKSFWWILLLLLVGLLGFAFWYFSGDLGFGDKTPEESAPVTEIEEPVTPAPEPVEEEPEVPVVEEEFSLTEINAKTDNPRYLVVVGSFIDGDLAKDFSDRLNQRQYSTYIIQPGYGSSFYKLAIAEFDNVVDATALIKNEQENFEETLWVLKY